MSSEARDKYIDIFSKKLKDERLIKRDLEQRMKAVPTKYGFLGKKRYLNEIEVRLNKSKRKLIMDLIEKRDERKKNKKNLNNKLEIEINSARYLRLGSEESSLNLIMARIVMNRYDKLLTKTEENELMQKLQDKAYDLLKVEIERCNDYNSLKNTKYLIDYSEKEQLLTSGKVDELIQKLQDKAYDLLKVKIKRCEDHECLIEITKLMSSYRQIKLITVDEESTIKELIKWKHRDINDQF